MHRKIRLMLLVLSITTSLPAIGWTAAQVTLAWDSSNSSDIIGYRVYAREKGETYNYAHPEWQGEQAQCTLPGFDELESYYFVVRALDSNGNESGDSNEVYWNPGGNADASLNGDANGGGGGSGCFIETLF